MVPATSHSRNLVVCVDLNEDLKHDDDDDPFFFTQNHQAVEVVSSFSSDLSHPHLPDQDQQRSSHYLGGQPPKHLLPSGDHEKGEKIIPSSRQHGSSLLSRDHYSAADHHQEGSSSSSNSVKWLPSKKRILTIRNMTMVSSEEEDQKAGSGSGSGSSHIVAEGGKGNSVHKNYCFQDQQQPFSSPPPPLIAATTHNNTNNNNNITVTTVRVCSDCHTTKTPLWRSGPSGPKSLCNACGIRQRKARRAAAIAAVATNGAMINPVAAEGTGNRSNNKKFGSKDKKSKMECSAPQQLKKKRKLIGVGRKQCQGDGRKNKLGFEDLKLMRLCNKNFPHQDEIEIKEAAILLMALSYGHLLVHG